MKPDDTVTSDPNTSQEAAAIWPYIVGLSSVVIGAVGLTFAPISGIVYLSLPGVAFATYHSFASHSPVRIAVTVSAVAFTLGLMLGAVALYSFSGDNFILQEWASMAALFGMPILGIVVGLLSLTIACFRPGNRAARLPRSQPV